MRKEHFLSLAVGLFLIGLGLKDDYLKVFLLTSVFLFSLAIIRSKDWWREVIFSDNIRLILSFFVVLFIFGVVLPGRFYDNQKYFFYFYPAYFFASVLGFVTVRSKVPLVSKTINLAMICLSWMVTISTLLWAYQHHQWEYWSGRFGHYNQLGMFIGAVASFLVGSWLSGKRSLIWTITGFVAIGILVGSYSRGSIISFALAVGSSYLLNRKGTEGSIKKKFFYLFLVLLVLFGIVGMFYSTHKRMRERVQQTLHLSLSGRDRIWALELERVKKRPLGWGIVEIHEGRNPHNQVLAMLLAGGIVVAAYFFWLNVWVAGRPLLKGRFYLPAMAMLLFFLFDSLVESSLIGIWDNSLLYWFSLGMVSGEKI